MKTIIFYDLEATSVSRDADIISIGLVAVTKSLDFNFQFSDKDYPENELLYYLEDFLKLNCKNYCGYNVNHYEILDQHPSDTIRFSIENRYYQIPHTITQGKQHLIDVVIPEIKKYLGNHFNSNTTIKTFYGEFTDFDINKCDDWVKENVVSKLQIPRDLLYIRNSYFVTKQVHCGDTNYISTQLKQWLSQFDKPEFWTDYDVIDKPMLIDLIADWNTSNSSSYLIDISAIPSNLNIEDVIKNWKKYSTITTAIKPQVTKNYKTGLPKHLPTINYYDFYDLHTLFLLKGIDPNINREDFAFSDGQGMSYHIEQMNKLGLTAVKHTAIWDAYVSYLCYEKLMKI